MKKQKLWKVLLVTSVIAALAITACFGLVACKEEHEHTYSTTWNNDETNHWHDATCEHKTEKGSLAAHDTKGTDGACSVCGYKATTPPTHQHTLGEWQKDATEHYKLCTGANCTDAAGTKYEKAAHDTKGTDGACSVCGYKATTPPTHQHTLGEWQKDATEHYKLCTGANCTDAAGTKYEKAAHDTKGTDGACSVCGYKATVEHQHTYSNEWTTNETHHWNAATCGHDTEQDNYGAHDTTGTDGACSVCGYKPHVHEFADTWSSDENGHWYAATCGHDTEKKDAAAHVDANNDGVCDVCTFGTVATKAAELLAKDGATKVVADNFIVNKTLSSFANWGTAGIYQGIGSGGTEVNNAKAYVEIVDGKANLKTPDDKPATYLYIDFGTIPNAAIIEGYFEVSGFTKASGFTPVQFAGVGGEKEEVFGLRANTTWQYRLDGGSNVTVAGAPNAEGSQIYFSYNTTTNTITVTINGTAFVTDLKLSGTNLKGIKFSSGDSNNTTFSIDNIAVIYTEISVDDYKTIVNANVATLETAANALKSGENWSSDATADALTTAKTTVTEAITAATTLTAVDEAYATYETAVLAAIKVEYEARLEAAYPANKYTVNATAYGTAMTAAKATINAVTAVDGFAAAYTSACDEFANVEDDTATTIANVTFVIKNADDEQVATHAVKAGDTVTVDDLKAKITAPEGKEIEGLYEEVTFTTAVTTLDTTATEDKTVTVYVKFVDRTLPDKTSIIFQNVTDAKTKYGTIAANTKFEDNDLFSITADLKLEYTTRDTSNATYISNATLHDGTTITQFDSGLKYNSVAKATTDVPTQEVVFATFEAKANISLYFYIKASDSGYKSNRTKASLVAKIVHADGSEDTVNDAIAFTNRDKLQEFSYTLLKGDKVVVTIQNTDTGNAVHVWLFAAQAELTKTAATEATALTPEIHLDEVVVNKNDLA